MRSDRQMMDLILSRAREDDRVLAAYLKGSRANPRADRDVFQDFDVMYVVREVASFRSDPAWLEGFGLILLKQEQNSPFGYGARFGLLGDDQEAYSWLLLFADGTRIDLGVETVDHLNRGAFRNRLFLPLLDKVGCLPQLPPPTDADFWVQRPDQRQLTGCCNEFFWSLCDVVKGIARQELPFAMGVYHSQTRAMLDQMLSWYVGTETDFSLSCGKHSRYFGRYLPPELYRRYCETYPGGSFAQLWQAVECAQSLFAEAAQTVACRLSLTYPAGEEEGFDRYAAWAQSQAGRPFPEDG